MRRCLGLAPDGLRLPGVVGGREVGLLLDWDCVGTLGLRGCLAASALRSCDSVRSVCKHRLLQRVVALQLLLLALLVVGESGLGGGHAALLHFLLDVLAILF